MRYWGQRLVTAGDQGKIFCYDSSNGELTSDYRFSDKFVTSIAVNGKNDIMFANSSGEVGLFREGSVSSFPSEHMKYIRSSAFLHDYNKVVLAADDLRISVFDMYCYLVIADTRAKVGRCSPAISTSSTALIAIPLNRSYAPRRTMK